SPRKKKKKPAVLGAVISLGNCLDLTDKKWIDLVRISYETFKETAELEGSELPVNTNPPNNKKSKDLVIRKVDCAVMKIFIR
ncbi:MAG TPA: hypothetical protein VFS25_04700, partial [Chitinophaga sp.]|uniref:hypothetical protein n=1 Tax=Chitinophaga sp. TaxID=1869181 RepID=UPI002DBCAA8F